MKVALVQESPVVADLEGNAQRLLTSLRKQAELGAQLAVCSELALCAYPPRDYLDRSEFIDDQRRAIDRLAKDCPLPTLVGFVDVQRVDGNRRLFNAAALLVDGEVNEVIHKSLLPTYDVFDEARYFTPASERKLIGIGGVKVGVSICEDIWNDADFWPEQRYRVDPIAELASLGAQVLINLCASPFAAAKRELRCKMLCAQAKKHALPLLVVNQSGAHDDLVFDGGSMAIDAHGQVQARLREFQSDAQIVQLDPSAGTVAGALSPQALDSAGEIEACFRALVLGLRDYAKKCGFRQALLGLSGGIDSAVTAAIAAHALGPENVLGIALPSKFSSDHSIRDAQELADNFGIKMHTISIAPTVASIESSLAELFAGKDEDVTEENIQARARGIILMGISNKFGHLLLNTGNKSEVAVGYCTLYGDMCGGLSILSDVFKTDVYRLAAYANELAGKEVIPQSTIDKPPSAELRPGQLDQDSLPDYPVLDEILRRYVEEDCSAAQIAEEFPEEVVRRVIHLVKRAEYKRYQLAPGIKVRGKSFGPGRRMPLAAK